MEESGEQDNIGAEAKSNLFQRERGIGGVTGSIDKGRIGSKKNQSDQLIGSLIVEQNPCCNNWGVREIPGLYAYGETLYASGNAIRNLDSTENLCKDNLNNNRQSEKQESSMKNQLCRRYFVPDAGLVVIGERNRVDCIGVQEIWMGDQREQEQLEARIAICVPGIDVQISNNENLIDQRQEEGVESTSSKIDESNNAIKIAKDQKHDNFGWQTQVFHSIIQTRRTASIANKQINEQSGESNGLDKRNDSNEEDSDRAVLLDESAGEQQIKDDRQEKKPDNNSDIRINFGIGCECDKNNVRIRRLYKQQKADMENSNMREILTIYRAVQLPKEYNNLQEYG
ncbi:MAG: hypothetical protein EZS28_003299 [Streblomastix strix]|uniref:Uncharacterized protein n=1 Tax=Streblomastix strix TaxID=222440 RepID=A0A5J4X331_9EUKA|nr:MAG: hypothetical protein EZS28_003299 [Streblomastix strix]